VAEIIFRADRGTTRLSHLYQHDPLRVLFPTPEPGEPPAAVLVTTSGGLVAGDRIAVTVGVGPSAAAHITASAAEKLYRSTGATTVVSQRFTVENRGWLEYLPPETILFDGARMRRATVIELDRAAGFLGGGIVAFGRRARGERFTRGFLNDRWEISRGGALVWGDALHLDGDVAALTHHPACFDGAEACATLVLALPECQDPRGLLDEARALQQGASGDVRAGVTVVNGLLVARWLGAALPVRRAYADLACHLRAAAMGLPPRLPRLWHV
jgi:urease accessory protein